MTNPTTPDQGDERRALSILATFVHETWEGAYSWSELEHKARTALERAGLLSLRDVLALSDALAAPHPSQGAEPDWRTPAAAWLRQKAAEQESINAAYPRHLAAYPSWGHRVFDRRWLADELDAQAADAEPSPYNPDVDLARSLTAAGPAAPHPPVSAEAGKGATVVVPWEPTTAMVNAGQCGCMDNDVTVSIYKAMLAAAPSESVAVSGEVSERVAKCSAILTLIDNYAPEKLGTAERTHLAVAVDAVLALAGSGGKKSAALERMARLDDEMGELP